MKGAESWIVLEDCRIQRIKVIHPNYSLMKLPSSRNLSSRSGKSISHVPNVVHSPKSLSGYFSDHYNLFFLRL